MESIYLDPNSYQAQQLTDLITSCVMRNEKLDLINKLGAKIQKDGDQFLWLVGEFPNDCIVGFGSTASEACDDFWNNYHNQKA